MRSGHSAIEYDPEEFRRITELLQFEITEIRARESQPGWTTWAILGALAATLWLLIKELENSAANLWVLLFLLLVFSLFIESITILHKLTTTQSSYLTSPFRFQPARSLLSDTRSSTLINLGRFVGLMILTKAFAPIVCIPIVVVTYTFLGGHALIFSLGFLLSFLGIPVTDYYRLSPSC